MEKDTKTIKVSTEQHKRLKIEAIERGITLEDLVWEIISEHLT